MMERARSISPSVKISAANLRQKIKTARCDHNSALNAPQHSVTIHTSVFEIDSRSSSSCHDNLQLVVPSVGAGSYLYAILQIVSSTEKIVAQLCETVRVRVVQAYDE